MGVGASNLTGLSTEQVLQQIAEYFQSRNWTVQDAFVFLDQDQNGRVTWQEFLRGVRLCLGDAHSPTISDTSLWNVFQRFDANKDGMISIEEFAAAFAPATGFHADNGNLYYNNWGRQIPGASYGYNAKLSQSDEDRSRRTIQAVLMRLASSLARIGRSPEALFRSLDIDGNGLLSRQEVERAVVALEPTLSQTELALVFAQFDRDGNQTVDFREFCDTLTNVNAPALLAVEDKVKMIIWKFKDMGYSNNDVFALFDRDNRCLAVIASRRLSCCSSTSSLAA
jgi:Ca2+-binding EF-hand superfamily protein